MLQRALRMALGALIIQTKFQYADREFVEQITKNPYLQYFIVLPDYQERAPFDVSTLVIFRKRISAEAYNESTCLSEETQMTIIALSVFVSNLFRMQKQIHILCTFVSAPRLWQIYGAKI